jgi:23S rRNA pseudouridine1911/1915/1917 synthase
VTIEKASFQDRLRPRDLDIVYEDQHLLVVNKHDGLLSNSKHPGDKTVITVLNQYLAASHQRCHAHIVHRLDRDTSGLMVVSKSKEVSQKFEEDWKGMVFDRRYVAVAWGHIEPPKGEVKSWFTDGEFCVLSSPTDNGGKLAVTHYEVKQTSRRYSLVELKLDTGRRNQIRVHLRDLKHPVVHDPMYGYKDDLSPVNRLCLHAFRLCFRHPVTGRRLQFETPIPSTFLKLMEL